MKIFIGENIFLFTGGNKEKPIITPSSPFHLYFDLSLEEQLGMYKRRLLEHDLCLELLFDNEPEKETFKINYTLESPKILQDIHNKLVLKYLTPTGNPKRVYSVELKFNTRNLNDRIKKFIEFLEDYSKKRGCLIEYFKFYNPRYILYK